MNLKRSALEAELLEEDARDLYEHAPCGYLSASSEGLLIRVNSTFLEWTGFSRDELLGARRFLDLLTAGGRIFYETHFAPLLRMQGFVREIAFDIACKDARTLPVLVNAAVREHPADGVRVLRFTVFDASDRRRYERELLVARERAEHEAHARQALLSMLSHDIRTPLNAIVLATELLERSDPAPHQAPFIRVLRSSTADALALVNNTLEISRVEAGHTVLREREFDLRQAIGELMHTLELQAAAKRDLELRLSIDDRVPSLLVGDQGKIRQVLANLLSNALKFTSRGFVALVVSAREVTAEDATLDVTVSDTGIGIPADRLPHIFEEFTQASDDIAEAYGGTGLGLAITRKLLQLYGSTLSVTSTVGQGSVFTFTLRLKRPVGAV